jgi:hypothetical protein
MTSIRNRRVIAAVVAASCLSVPASASAGSLPSTYKSDAAQAGSAVSLPSSDRSDAAQSGSDAGNRAATPYSPTGFKGGDSAQRERTATTTFPPAEFRGGDTPVDHPGASRALTATPTTIEVVRPERTIVRDVDEALPLILSSTALLLVLAGVGVALIRTRMAPRPGHSSSA